MKPRSSLPVLAACLLGATLALPTTSGARPPERVLPRPDIELPPRGGQPRRGARCAADEVNAPHRPPHAGLHGGASLSGLAAISAERVVPVAFHVIYSSRRGTQTGNVAQARIDQQIQVLNDAFAGQGFSFYLASVDRTSNRKWFSNCYSSGAESQMKSALAIDPATHLNIYTCAPSQDILGYAYLPDSFPEDNPLHGVVLHHETLPGGGFTSYNLGDTGTHEVGHYLGLEHTFARGCSAPGDYVADTPYEASPAYGCPVGRDTCASPGLDPIFNFMDYTHDSCMFEFTAGQAARMDAEVGAYKPSLGSPPPGCGDGNCDAGEDSCACPVDCGAPPATESSCTDGGDNDCDGDVDCADADCAAAPTCSSSCSGAGASCSSGADCCSGKCKGKPGNQSCR